LFDVMGDREYHDFALWFYKERSRNEGKWDTNAIFPARSQKGFLITVFLPMRTFVCRYGFDVKRDAAICTGRHKML
jgi:hypothetical protein